MVGHCIVASQRMLNLHHTRSIQAGITPNNNMNCHFLLQHAQIFNVHMLKMIKLGV